MALELVKNLAALLLILKVLVEELQKLTLMAEELALALAQLQDWV